MYQRITTNADYQDTRTSRWQIYNFWELNRPTRRLVASSAREPTRTDSPQPAGPRGTRAFCGFYVGLFISPQACHQLRPRSGIIPRVGFLELWGASREH